MATYDITSHSLLSAKAKALTSEELNQQVISAELIFDLYQTTYTGDDALVAELILVHQVNFQVENDQNSELYSRIIEGEREFTYRNVPVSEYAKTLRLKLDEGARQEQESLKQVGNSQSVGNHTVW